MKHIIVLSLLLLTSCSRVWVVRQDATGGIIGYKHSSKKQIAEVIPCDWVFVSDDLRSNTEHDIVYRTVSTTSSYGAKYTTNMPVETESTDYWRELTYLCK